MGPPFSLQPKGSVSLYCLSHHEVWFLNSRSAPFPFWRDREGHLGEDGLGV